MSRARIKEEIRRRIPRLTMSLITATVFWIISAVVPQTVSNINIPGLDIDAGFLIWTITVIVLAIFLVRALSDALVLGDVATDIIVRRMGIKEERSPKRAARDLIYIIVIILVTSAILPFAGTLGNNVGYWLTLAIIYSSLGMIIILVYDIGRVIYRIIEQRAESLADSLSRMVDKKRKSKG